jgi:hypothetical protein
VAKNAVQNLAIVRRVFGRGCSRYLNSWVDLVLLQVKAFLALALALALAQVMEMALELHVDFYHRNSDTGFGFRKPLAHTSCKLEYPSRMSLEEDRTM